MLGRLLDSALDFTVAPGYTKLGFQTRRRLGWQPLEAGCMIGRSVIVTGASSGLGLAAARGLSELGARVTILVRDRERGERAALQIDRGGGVAVELADLSSLASVRSFAARFAKQHASLNVLVNNAGVLAGERELSVDGNELTFATNVLGMFVLTNELLPLLHLGAPSRIINVSSGGMYSAGLDADDLQSTQRDYSGTEAYARSKRAEVVLSEIWAQRLRGSGIVVHSMHPGWADTPGVQSSLPTFRRLTGPLLRSAEEGADTIVWLAAAPEPANSSGLFWHDRRPRPTHRLPWTRESARERRELWEACVRLGGQLPRESEELLAGSGG